MNKVLIILTAFILSFQFNLRAEETLVSKYHANLSSAKLISFPFGEAQLEDTNGLNELKNTQIEKIELVYSSYRSSSNFNQTSLNNRRVNNLKKAFKAHGLKMTKVHMIGQTEGKTKAAAKMLIHGFVIHYQSILSYPKLKKFFSRFQKPFNEFEIDNAQGKTCRHKSGSKIHVPAEAVIHKDGEPVTGIYTLKYKEFRNPAEIAVSGIPMIYDNTENQDQFNSVGMYELRAVQNGKELKLKKPLKVDFNCTSKAADVGFFALDDETGQWTKKGEVNFDKNEEAQENENARFISVINKENNIFYDITPQKDRATFRLDKRTFKAVNDLMMKSVNTWKNDTLAINDEKQRITVPNTLKDDLEQLISRVWMDKFFVRIVPAANLFNPIGGANGGGNATLLAEGADQGHTYPNLVKGLNSGKFGVYNCDQIYRVKNNQNIVPKYITQAGKKIVLKGAVACLIDLAINGSFSFIPSSVTLNPRKRNALLLFTKNKKVFFIQPKHFKEALSKNKRKPTLQMQDMTLKLKTSDDLSELLGL
jgi:hypothetical protein